jgi:hypothetical protein
LHAQLGAVYAHSEALQPDALRQVRVRFRVRVRVRARATLTHTLTLTRSGRSDPTSCGCTTWPTRPRTSRG